MSGRKCMVCSPRKCRTGYLYVVEDVKNGLVKIGCTVNVSRRLASYRANGSTHFELRHKRRAGCEWTAAAREEKALGRFSAEFPRVRGDWHKADVSRAITIVEDVCVNISPVVKPS